MEIPDKLLTTKSSGTHPGSGRRRGEVELQRKVKIVLHSTTRWEEESFI
jgi:hypothetical protein